MKALVFVYILYELLIDSLDGKWQNKEIHEYFRWTHKDVFSQNLYCADFCKSGTHFKSGMPSFQPDPTYVCCCFTARPYWTFPKKRNILHYLTITENDMVINRTRTLSKEEQSTVYYIHHPFRRLSTFPTNICSFHPIVYIQLSGNNITTLPSLDCLDTLDSLDMSYNNIRIIHSNSFSSLFSLRFLDMSYNKISLIDPGTFGYRPGSLMYINLRGNRLIKIDISNLILGYQFAKLDVSSNFLGMVTNELNRTYFSEKAVRGGGVISVKYNKFRSFPDLRLLGFNSFHIAVKFGVRYYPLFAGNPWLCDCKMFDAMKVAIAASIYHTGVQATCTCPNGVKGTIQDFRKNESLFDFVICNINMTSKCPPMCDCFRQPSNKRVAVNCSGRYYSRMTEVLPDFEDLDIDFSHNNIRKFSYYKYLYRAKRINLSYNKIMNIDPSIFSIQTLKHIDLRYNHIKTLDRSIQQKNPMFILLGTLFLGKCDCTFRWIKTWIDRPTAQAPFQTTNVIKCSKESNVIDISLLSEKDLCEIKPSNIWQSLIICVVGLGLVSCFVYYNFKYELYFLIQRRICHLKHQSRIELQFDVYLSFCIDNDDVTKWTINRLCCHLESKRKSVCLPPRDFALGDIQMDQIGTNIGKSKTFIVVLSQDYERSHFQNSEWKYICDELISDSSSKLVIINFDMLDSSVIINKKLKAFIRLGWYLDFQNFDKTLLLNIEKQIDT